MDAASWAVVGAAIAILAAIGTAFWSLRNECGCSASTSTTESTPKIGTPRAYRRPRRAHRRPGQAAPRAHRRPGKETGEQIGQLRERMAKLERLLEGLREAVTSKRAA